MAVKFTNNAKTTLASGINSSVTTATVTDGSVFPTLGAGEHFYCTFDDGTNNEIVKVTARSGNTLTIVRGVDNTTARSFSASDAAELRATSALLTDIQENIAAKSANQTVYNTTTASSATDYDIGIDPSVEANAMVFLNGVMQHHDTFSFSGSTLSFDTAPPNGMALEVIVDNLINLQSSNLTVDTFTAADVSGNPQTDFTLSDAPAAEDNLLVFIDGVFQDQDAYTISNQTLTITDGVTADFGVTVYVINPVNIGTPSDNTVTSSKLSGNITMPADLTVTGDVAFDSPTFVVDNANSRVGIGTASPSTLLDIVGDVKMSANLTVDTSTLVVDSTNNRVGIGTTSPSQKLEVAGNIFVNTSGNPIITNKTTGAGNNPVFRLQADTNYWDLQGTFSNTNDELFFMYNGSTKLAIDNSGNVAIGSTSDALANMSGLFRILDSTGGDRTVAHFGAHNYGDTGKTFINIGTEYGDGTSRIGSFNDTGNSSVLVFDTHSATSGQFTERMRIDSSGNVGIGTSSLSRQLQLYKSSNSAYSSSSMETTNLQLYIRNADTTVNNHVGLQFAVGNNSDAAIAGVRTSDANAALTFGTRGTGSGNIIERMRIDSSGNVGIQNNNPSSALEVGNGTSTYVKIRNASTGDISSGYNIESGSTTTTSLYGNAAEGWTTLLSGGSLHFRVNNAVSGFNPLNITTSGDIGIGTSSPSQQLTVYNSTAPKISLDYAGGSNNGGSIDFNLIHASVPAPLTTQIKVIDDGAYRQHLTFLTKTSATDSSGMSERVRITSSGNLCVGITSPLSSTETAASFRTDSAGAPALDISKISGNTSSANVFIRFHASSGGTAMGAIAGNGSANAQFIAVSDERLKENINPLSGSLNKVLALNPVSYDWKKNGEHIEAGFVAQEVEEILPEYVTTEENEEQIKGLTGGMTAGYIAVLTKAIQEQQEQIETLKQEIREIKESG